MKNVFNSLDETFLDTNRKEFKYRLPLQNSNKDSQKFYAFFIFGNFHPMFTNSIDSVLNFYFEVNKDRNNLPLELFFCSCDEEENEFNRSFDLILDKYKQSLNRNKIESNNFLFIPFKKGKTKQNLLSHFKIESLPRLIIVNYKGDIVAYFNQSEISNLNKNLEDTFRNQNKIYFGINLRDKFQIGDKTMLSIHSHSLVYTDYTLKKAVYRTGTWTCDECSKTYQKEEKNFYCGICGYDLCFECYEKLC